MSDTDYRRVLGIDHGSRRIGLAWTDALLLTAQPGEVLESRSPEADLAYLKELCRDRDIGLVVVGLPRNMDGTIGPQAARVEAFVARLREALGLPVVTWDERLSSVEAEEVLDAHGFSKRTKKGRERRKAMRDAIAASVILASFLEARRDEIPELMRG